MRLNTFILFILLSTLSTFTVSASNQSNDNATFDASVYKPPVDAFGQLPSFEDLSLSPSGLKIAYVQNAPAPENMAVLITLDLTKGERKALLTSDNKKVKINWFRWANDDVLIVSAAYESRDRGTLYYQTRMFSLDLTKDKPKPKQLIRPNTNFGFSSSVHSSQFQDNVIDFLPNDPDHILVSIDLDQPLQPSVYRVNVHTARMKRVQRDKLLVRNWYTDQQSVVRIGRGYNYDTGEVKYWHRKTKEDNFEVIFNYTIFENKPVSIRGFGLDPNIMYYTQYKGDKRALYKMDLTTKESELLLAHDDYDVNGSLIYSEIDQDAIGVYDAHSPFGRFYFDDKYYGFHKALDKSLPDTHNVIKSFNKDRSIYVLYIESDSKPGQYLYGNRTKKSLQGLFSTYAKLDNAVLAEHEKITYTTRDGLEIEALLTLPLFGQKPYPTVVHPHGGPGSRDFDGFDPWVSYLSSRGYAVVRPNFRGSTGYGYEFAQAQMGQWGLEMQDDISDATEYLITEGISDKDKVCIFGASYGGYAAKMATVKTPDLYTCAVSFAGVSDLKELSDRQSRFAGGELIADKQIGDKTKDLRARSPISYVEKIKTPLLIMHGEEDRSVHIEQSRDFVEELEDEGKQFRYVEFEYGDHHLSIQQNRVEFFQELDAFLRQYLGSPEVEFFTEDSDEEVEVSE